MLAYLPMQQKETFRDAQKVKQSVVRLKFADFLN